MTARPPRTQRVFAANWKMHHGPAAARAYVQRFVALVPARADRELWLFVPAASLAATSEALAAAGRRDVHVGAQHVHWEAKGAFTGEMSVGIAREAGAAGALVGHSERRHRHYETALETEKKMQAITDAGLVGMLCVGETLEEREDEQTMNVVRGQLVAGLADVRSDRWDLVRIAYEPVWAIGTGRTASPDDAAKVHAGIRLALGRLGAPPTVPVLYGGSVNRGNVAALLANPEIDGVLVGGASIDPEGWAELVNSEA